MEGLPNNKPQVRYNEQGFIIEEETTVDAEASLSEDEVSPDVAEESEDDFSEGGETSEDMKESEEVEEVESVETIESSKEALPHESLAAVAVNAKNLEVLMKERASHSMSKEFMSPTQAEAFSHLFEMATESIKNGDIEGFNQDLKQLGPCFERYGVDKGGAVREDIKSLEGVGREFAGLRRNFDTVCKELNSVPGVDTNMLSKIQTHFAKIDGFHSKLYKATRSYLR